MTNKTTVQITKDNIEQFDIRVGTILKDNEGMYWRITDFNDFSAGMRVCDKDGNEIENFVGNAGRAVFGGGLSDLLNDGVATYFIETEQPEIKEEKNYNFFVKDSAEFEQFAKFEPITNLAAEEAVAKFYELQKKGFNSGIGINIPNDIVFDDSKGSGSTIVVIDEEKKANFSIFGDSFINNVNIETNSDTLKTRISAYEELYNKLIEQNIPTEYPQFVFEKKVELEKKLDSQNYDIHDETVSASEIEEEKLFIQRRIQRLKDELNNPDVNNPDDDQYISETKRLIERLENMTDDDFKNLAAEKKEQQKKNEESHSRFVEQMIAEKQSREIPQEGELLSYNEIHPTYSVVNKKTNEKTSIQPRGRLEENVKKLGKLSSLAEANNVIEKIKSSGFEILSTERRVIIFNEDKYYDFDSGDSSYFNYTTNEFEFTKKALSEWDFKKYIKGGLKITKQMKAFEKNEFKTVNKEKENEFEIEIVSDEKKLQANSSSVKQENSESVNKEKTPVIYFNDLSPEQQEEVINGYRSADDQDMLTEWENVLRKNLTQIKKDNPFIPSLDIEKEISVAANPPSDEWISEYLQKNNVNFNTDFWQDIFAEMEAPILKESDVKDLEISPVSLEEILSVMEMKPEVTSEGKIKIYDQQRQEYIDNRSLFSDSDDDNWSFYNAAEIFERLDIYINDYFITDFEEQLEAGGVTLKGNETLKDLCDYAKEQLEAGITTVSQDELNLAMGIVNPDTVIMPEGFIEQKQTTTFSLQNQTKSLTKFEQCNKIIEKYTNTHFTEQEQKVVNEYEKEDANRHQALMSLCNMQYIHCTTKDKYGYWEINKGKEISANEARRLMSYDDFASGVDRASFHITAGRTANDRSFIYFNDSERKRDIKPYELTKEDIEFLSKYEEYGGLKENIPKPVLEQLSKTSMELTSEDLKNARALLPKEQYHVVLGYTQGEEGEHFKNIIKEISSKAEAIKGKREILTEDEKHPLAFKYTIGTSSFYFSEWDGEDELFGYAVLNGDTQNSEWGYTSLEELKNAGGKDINGFPMIPEMIFYGLEDTIEKQISVDYPVLSEKMGFAPKLNHNEELISEFGKEIFETLQSRKLEQNAYNICCATQFVIRTMDSSEKKEIFSIMKRCGCEGKNGKANTEDFLTEVVKSENKTASSVYDRKRLYEKINKACLLKKLGTNKTIHSPESDYEREI